MTILTVGIDLAKNVFALHGVNEWGKADLLRPAVPREQFKATVAALPPCVIGMEACSGAHHWAREFQALGHTVLQSRVTRRVNDCAGGVTDSGMSKRRSRGQTAGSRVTIHSQ